MNRILKIGVASIAFGLIATAASAASFTFTGTLTSTDSLMVNTGEPTPIVAGFSTGASSAVYSTGEKRTSKSTCAAWTVPPGTPFTSNGICTFTESNGDQSSIIFGCFDDNKTGASDCWGGLRGISGGTTGQTGTIVWHQVRSTDGKTGNVNGTGQWN
jgi:hypothetical protein